ncbi:beta-fructofuranosidase [Devosia lucknowensis]|uniref:beta-fructofuranosidase n=1 Tax=Devosia lucknowensis TaxID=1096929 RepID=A0A1Y6FHY5_9HYPH|nr:glycosyl hydrolase family 32 [Devosia lucknowensis]SMQ73171.1 beta-fructofuranosidase [Devosia lucknowensis]
MAFHLPDHWVWDFWLADDGESYHLFYLHAPKSLGNPDLRHRNARIGRATSTDLRNWTDHGQIFNAGPEGSFDGSATWTGSVVRGPDNLWRLFYTGSRFLSPDTVANIETVGLATSPDLVTWTKQPGPVCVADPDHYETLGTSSWPEEAWRDPWVYWRQADQRWHMLTTARGKHGSEPDRGIMGHAVSIDLKTWTVNEPIGHVGSGFAHLEVFQIVEVAGQRHLVFCCDTAKLCGARVGQTGGIWSLPVGDLPGPVDFSAARLLVDETLYAGRISFDRDGQPCLLAFHNVTENGSFRGGICDPLPITSGADGYLRVAS